MLQQMFKRITVKIARSGLGFLSFILIFLFLELRVRVSDDITQSHISHIRCHSDSDGHKSHDAWKDVKHSGRDDIIQCMIYILTLRCIHGHLG